MSLVKGKRCPIVHVLETDLRLLCREVETGPRCVAACYSKEDGLRWNFSLSPPLLLAEPLLLVLLLPQEELHCTPKSFSDETKSRQRPKRNCKDMSFKWHLQSSFNINDYYLVPTFSIGSLLCVLFFSTATAVDVICIIDCLHRDSLFSLPSSQKVTEDLTWFNAELWPELASRETSLFFSLTVLFCVNISW